MGKNLIIHCDGSYSTATNKVGWGFMLSDYSHSEYGVVEDKEACTMNQIAGELSSVMRAILYAVKLGEKSVIIKYDYVGIQKWPDMEWKAKKPQTISYVAFIDKYRKLIDIKFEKISRELNLADELAKKGSGAIN